MSTARPERFIAPLICVFVIALYGALHGFGGIAMEHAHGKVVITLPQLISAQLPTTSPALKSSSAPANVVPTVPKTAEEDEPTVNPLEKDWKFSKDGPFIMSRNPDATPPPMRCMAQADGLWHFLVSLEHKFMWCNIYKVASSEMSPIFFRMENDPDWAQFFLMNFTRSKKGCAWLSMHRKGKYMIPADWDEPEPHPAHCEGIPQALLTAHQYPPLETNATALVSSKEMKKAVMVRDPYDRLKSGLMDKCIKRLFYKTDGPVPLPNSLENSHHTNQPNTF